MGNSDLHRAAHEAFNARKFDDLRKMMNEDVVFEDLPRAIAMKSPDEFIDWARQWTGIMSDAQVTERTYYEVGNTSICRFTGVGTNDGAMGPIKASGNRLSLEFCELTQWDADGKITRGEILYDQMTMLVQLGVVEPPPAP